MQKEASLSISNSSKNKIIIIKIIFFSFVFFIINHFIGMELDSYLDDKDIYSKLKWDEFYSMEDNSLDLIFLGSSHAYRSFNSKVIDEKLKIDSFNMGSPLQKPVESYYILKEVLKHHKPKMLVFDLYWGMFNEEKYFKTKTWNYDSLKFSTNKLGYLFNVYDYDQYLPAMVKSIRYHDKFEDYIKYKINNKSLINLNKDAYIKKYEGRGFVINNEQTSREKLLSPFEGAGLGNSSYKWNDRQLEYLDKIMKVCKENDIEVFLVTAPLAPTHLEMIDKHWYSYEEVHNKASQIARDYESLYLDFNMVNKVNNIVKDDDFSDSNHLNYAGATKVSIYLSEYINEKFKEFLNESNSIVKK